MLSSKLYYWQFIQTRRRQSMGLVLNNEKEKHLILNTDNGIE